VPLRAAQESYFQNFGQYCGTLQPALHPAVIPFEGKETWNPPANSPWRDLSIQSAGRVWFQYYLVAGTANQNPPADAPFLPAEVNGRPVVLGRARAVTSTVTAPAQVPCSGALVVTDRMASKLSFLRNEFGSRPTWSRITKANSENAKPHSPISGAGGTTEFARG
jgi:hypothetical protein